MQKIKLIWLYLEKKGLMRPLRFLLIGGSLYILSVVMLFFFMEKLGMKQQVAYLIQTIVTYIMQFGLNAVLTWGDRKAPFAENVRRVAKYIPVKILLWGTSQGVFAFWLLLGFHYQLANAVTVLLVMGINYFVFDRVIFVRKKGF